MQRPILRMEVPKKSQIKTATPEELYLPPVVESKLHVLLYSLCVMVHVYTCTCVKVHVVESAYELLVCW